MEMQLQTKDTLATLHLDPRTKLLIRRCSPYQDMWAAFEQSDQWKMGGVNA